MDLIPGFQQTRVGRIPEQWRLATLGEVCVFENGDRGYNYPSPGSFVHSGIPFINAGHVGEGRIDVSDMDYITAEHYARLGSGKVKEGDILFCLRGSIGKFGVVSEGFGAGAIASSLVIVRPRVPAVSGAYLHFYFSSALCLQMIKTWSGGAAQPNLGAQDLARFLIRLPSSEAEQRAIAEALGDVDALLGALDRLIAKKRDLKQAAMLQLLTGQTRLPGFEGEWEAVRLGACLSCQPKYGINAAAVPYSDRLPAYIRITDINESGRFQPPKAVSVSHINANDYVLQENDIVFARTGASVGKSYLYNPIDGELVYAGFLIRIRPNPAQLIPAFLSMFVNTKRYWDWVGLMSMRSGQPGINALEYANLPIPLPQLPEQAAIVTVLSDMNAEIAALEARRVKIATLMKGMMQELLTGRTRLV